MNNVVSFSGGRTSAYLCHVVREMEKAGEIDNVHFVFLDTGAEHPKTYEFIKKCNEHFDLNLTCLKSYISPEKGVGPVPIEIAVDDIGWDLTMWRQMGVKYGMPFSPSHAHCTRTLKTTIYQKWCDEQFGKRNHTTWLGIRADEPRRIRDKEGFAYLASVSDFDKEDVLDWWSEQSFDLDLEEHLGNCVFCVKKGVKKVAAAMLDEPELAAEFSEMLSADGYYYSPNRKEGLMSHMYRNSMSMGQIADTYAGMNREDILASTKGSTNACTESCEVFNCQLALEI